MTSNNAEQPEAPVALFSTAPRLRRWLPLHLSALALFVVAIVLLIVSMFVAYATPIITLESAGAINDLPVDQVFPGDVDAQQHALAAPCQALMNKGCDLLFPDLTNTSAMLNAMIASANPLDGTVDGRMVAEATPYEFISCEWVATVPPGTQVALYQWFPKEMVSVKVRSTTLPGMVNTSLSVGCQAWQVRGENITSYLILESDLLGLVDDPTGLQNGSSVLAPNISDIQMHSTGATVEYNSLFYTSVPCSELQSHWCSYSLDILVYIVTDDQIVKCGSGAPSDGDVYVRTCSTTPLQRSLGSSIPTLTTYSTMDYRYRASRDSVQLVAMDDPSRTQSAMTGQTTQRFSRDGMTRAAGITIVAIVLLGVALVVLIIAIICVACNHKRARKTTEAMQDGMTGPPNAHAVGRLVGPRGELLRHVADTDDGTSSPLFEYELPENQRDRDGTADEAGPYQQAAYYREGEEPSDVVLTPRQPEPAIPRVRADSKAQEDHTPYGSANETMWSADGEEVFVAPVITRKDDREPTSGQGFDDLVDEPLADATMHNTEAAVGPKGIPLRVEGSSDVLNQVGMPTVRQYMKHTTRMLFALITSSVLGVVGTLLAMVVLIVQALGSMEHWGTIDNYVNFRVTGVAHTKMHPEGGAMALYAIALVTALAATVITWCIMLCKVY